MLWTKAEEKKLLKAIAKATTVAAAVDSARLALPGRGLNAETITKKLQRLGMGALSVVVSMNASKVSNDNDGAELARFAAVAKKGVSLEDLCDQVDASPKKVKALVEKAKAAGYRIDIKAGQVGYVPHAVLSTERKVVAQPGEEHIFAVASDIHVGSRFFLEAEFVDFVKGAYAEGVRTIFVPGDILDGCYRHSRWDESHHGFNAQSDHAAKIFPRLPGLRYIGIAGNHDETFEKDAGLDVCRALEDAFRRAGRDDLQMLGARGAYVRFAPKGGRGVLVELWHPLGGGAYAVSYKLQRHVEEYGVGQKPDFCFAGHWHQQVYCVRRGVHCFLSGTFHGGGSSFSKALGGAQAIGGWIVRFKQTKDGTVRDVQPTWRAYYEVEQVREAALA